MWPMCNSALLYIHAFKYCFKRPLESMVFSINMACCRVKEAAALDRVPCVSPVMTGNLPQIRSLGGADDCLRDKTS